MMRNLLLCIALAVTILSVSGQAKKPILMVVPSDSYCDRNAFVQEFTDEAGNTRSISDYNKAFKSAESEELRLVISELSKIMADRGFPLKDLEQTMKSIAQSNVELSMLQSSSSGSAIRESPIDVLKRTAQADIIMDIDFSVKIDVFIIFEFNGLIKNDCN
jgi:hypothetical protein